MTCPKCKTPINEFQTQCGCGWKPKQSSGETCCGYTPEQCAESVRYWENYQPPRDLDAMAKGLIYLGSKSMAFKHAKEDVKQRAIELHNSGYRPNRCMV